MAPYCTNARGLSGNKEKLLALSHENSNVQNFPDLIRDLYFFEFLGLKPREVLPEKDREHVKFATAGLDDRVFVSKIPCSTTKQTGLEQFIKLELKVNPNAGN